MSEDEIIERVEHFININVLYGKTYGFTTDDLKKYQQVFKGLLDLYNNQKQQITELQAINEEHRKENGKLRKELKQELEKRIILTQCHLRYEEMTGIDLLLEE